MALRSFTAPDGTAWRVWQVVPTTVLHEGSERRRRERRGQDVLLYRGPERRTGERRKGLRGRTGVAEELEGGWLTFETVPAREKRRLCPPPAGWDELPDGELVGLLQRATPVPGFRPWGNLATP